MENASFDTLDSYEEAVRTFGMDQSEYEEFRAELAEEYEREAQEEFEEFHDEIGYLCDLFEPFGFEYHHEANSVRLRHFNDAWNENAWFAVFKYGDKFNTEYSGQGYGWNSMQEVIGQIIVQFNLNREDVFRDAALYGWGLPEFAGPRKVEFED